MERINMLAIIYSFLHNRWNLQTLNLSPQLIFVSFLTTKIMKLKEFGTLSNWIFLLKVSFIHILLCNSFSPLFHPLCVSLYAFACVLGSYCFVRTFNTEQYTVNLTKSNLVLQINEDWPFKMVVWDIQTCMFFMSVPFC